MDFRTVSLILCSICAFRFIVHAFNVFSSPHPKLPRALQSDHRSNGFFDNTTMFIDGVMLFVGGWAVIGHAFETLIWWMPFEWGFADEDGEWTNYRTFLLNFVGFWGGLWGVLEMHKVYPRLRQMDDRSREKI